MSHAHSHENTVPTPALVSAGLLVAFALAMTASVQLGWLDRAAVPSVERAKADVAPSARRMLAFADLADGSVRVTDAASGREVALIAAGSEKGGFVRGVLRGMARERRMHGIGAAPPFLLTLWQDGSLTLLDETTGRSVELGAFGPDNRVDFEALLHAGEAS